jgi:glucose dehydrogenase
LSAFGALEYHVWFDTVTGKILWHTWLPTATTNGATTFLLDGFQYVMIAAGDTLYAYTLNFAVTRSCRFLAVAALLIRL